MRDSQLTAMWTESAAASSAPRRGEADRWDADCELASPSESMGRSTVAVYTSQEDGMSSKNQRVTIHIPHSQPEGGPPQDSSNSPARMSPLLFLHIHGADSVHSPPPAPSLSSMMKGRRSREVRTVRTRLQSMDGGVRIAGGPLGFVPRDSETDRLSVPSTMPPAYQLHSP